MDIYQDLKSTSFTEEPYYKNACSNGRNSRLKDFRYLDCHKFS